MRSNALANVLTPVVASLLFRGSAQNYAASDDRLDAPQGAAAQAQSQDSTQQPHIVIFTGILGKDCDTFLGMECDQPRRLRDAIVNAGGTAEIWDWTQVERQGDPKKNLWINLNWNPLNRRRAHSFLIDQMPRLKAMHRPITLVAMSGGARLVFFMAEDPLFPSDFQFEKIVMLSGAAPTYWPVFKVVAKSRQGVFNYSSFVDATLALMVVPVIGNDGYLVHRNGVQQLPWIPCMIQTGNLGQHLDCVGEPFCSQCLVPLLLNDSRWPEECHP